MSSIWGSTRSRRTKGYGVLLALTCLSLRVGLAQAQTAPRLTPQEKWSNVFGGREVVFHFTTEGDQAWSGTASWRLSRDARTLASGESAVNVQPGQSATTTVRFVTPQVKEGVVMDAQLTVTLLESGRTVTNVEKQVRIFADDPFTQRQAWSKQLKIRLFDPEGQTARTLEEQGIPFDNIRNVDALAGSKGAVLMVGEGVSFREYRGLWDVLVRSAAAGAGVICLCPSPGEIAIPGAGESSPANPAALTFRKSDVIADLDKRLDYLSWPPNGVVSHRGVVLKGERGPVVGEIADGGNGWMWMDLSWSDTGGRLLLCTFGIIEKWTDSPAPRYLLLKMLEDVDGLEERRGDLER